MPARPQPSTPDILVVLERAANGQLAQRALSIHEATRALRLAFRTTNTTASWWLENLSTEDNPVVQLANAGSHRMLSSVWRGGWKPIRDVGLPGGEHGLGDFIALRADGTQTLDTDRPSTPGATQWVVLTPTLHTMAIRTRQHVAAKMREQRDRKAASLAAFESAHPQALRIAREFLARAEVSNYMTGVEGVTGGSQGRRIDGRMLGGPTHLTFTVYAEDIEPFVTLLASALGHES